MKWMTFQQYMIWREGLDEGMWLNDDEAIEGLSKLPEPRKKPKPKQPAVVKPIRVAKIKTQQPFWKTPGVGTL